MNTNRPLPYKRVLKSPDVNADLWHGSMLFEYFSDIPGGVTQAGERSLHGMPKIFLTKDNEWETLLNLQGPGMCGFLGFSFKNSSGTNQYSFSIKIFIDGSLIYFREYYTVGIGEQSGIAVIGNIFAEIGTSGKLRAAADHVCPFNRNLIVQAISENLAQLPAVVVHKTYFTR